MRSTASPGEQLSFGHWHRGMWSEAQLSLQRGLPGQHIVPWEEDWHWCLSWKKMHRDAGLPGLSVPSW